MTIHKRRAPADWSAGTTIHVEYQVVGGGGSARVAAAAAVLQAGAGAGGRRSSWTEMLIGSIDFDDEHASVFERPS